jgi:hypothetical protein
MSSVSSFIIRKWPYFIGFLIIEAGIYYFNRSSGNLTTGLLGIFAVWAYYAWTTRDSA